MTVKYYPMIVGRYFLERRYDWNREEWRGNDYSDTFENCLRFAELRGGIVAIEQYDCENDKGKFIWSKKNAVEIINSFRQGYINEVNNSFDKILDSIKLT